MADNLWSDDTDRRRRRMLTDSLDGGDGTEPVDPFSGVDTAEGLLPGESSGERVDWMEPPPAISSTSAWNTKGYATPGYTASTYGSAMPGWESSKWSDPDQQNPKYVVGRILSNYPTTVEGLTQAVAQIQQAYPGATFNGKDIITIPGVGSIDVLQGASEGGKAWQWGVQGEDGGDGAGGVSGGGFGEGIRSKLLELIGQPTNVSLTDPNLAPAAQAYRSSAQREGQRQREAIAERLNAQGMADSGALDTAVLGQQQETGQNIAGYEGQLVLNELTRRRDEIMQALSLGSNLLSADEQRALQWQLGQLNATLSREQMGLQAGQFEQGMNERLLQLLIGGTT